MPVRCALGFDMVEDLLEGDVFVGEFFAFHFELLRFAAERGLRASAVGNIMRHGQHTRHAVEIDDVSG